MVVKVKEDDGAHVGFHNMKAVRDGNKDIPTVNETYNTIQGLTE